MNEDSNRNAFLANVRKALGRDGAPPVAPPETALADAPDAAVARAAAVRQDAEACAGDLLDQLAQTAAQAGWTVERVASPAQAADYVARTAAALGATSIVRSTHAAVEQAGVDDERLAAAGIAVRAISFDPDANRREEERAENRAAMAAADMGVTGVDFAVAETGSVVIVARKGASRLVSLLPPVHVAIVLKGQVLPTLDELFTLRRASFYGDDFASYANIITGPSRSADIEQTLIKGMHGPREVHMVLVG